jgi:hypothetical protein
MAEYTRLIATTTLGGDYKITSQMGAAIAVNTDLIRSNGLFCNVLANFRRDEAAVIDRANFETYLLPKSHPNHQPAAQWYEALPIETDLIFVIHGEYDWNDGG